MLPELTGNTYTRPGIVMAVCQVLFDWSAPVLKEVCTACRNDLERTYGFATDRRRYEIDVVAMHANGRKKGRQTGFKSEYGGLEFKLQPEGSLIWVGHEGVVVHFKAPYPGRDRLINTLLDVLGIISKNGFDFPVLRSSILLSCNIDPKLDSYALDDYVVLTAEIPDPELATVVAFRQELAIDASNILPNVLAKVIFASTEQGRPGVDLTIDILDHTTVTFQDVGRIMTSVKDLETRIFETLITQKTRELYGIRA